MCKNLVTLLKGSNWFLQINWFTILSDPTHPVSRVSAEQDSNDSSYQPRSHLPRPQVSGKSESSASSNTSNHDFHNDEESSDDEDDDNLLAKCIRYGFT